MSPWATLPGLSRLLESDLMAPSFGNLFGGNLMQNMENLTLFPLDVSESDKEYTIKVDAPGMKIDDFRIELSRGRITLSGTRHEEHEDKETHRRERIMGNFLRSFDLPEDTDETGVKARYDHGVLVVSIPKKAEAQAKGKQRIQVESASESGSGESAEPVKTTGSSDKSKEKSQEHQEQPTTASGTGEDVGRVATGATKAAEKQKGR